MIFFIEDDYLFKKDSIEELLFSYSRISTQTEKELFFTPSDYVFYYDKNYTTSVFIGKNYRWRVVKETLLTFMFSKKLLNIYRNKIRAVGEVENDPFEKPLHEIFEKELCFALLAQLVFTFPELFPPLSLIGINCGKKIIKK